MILIEGATGCPLESVLRRPEDEEGKTMAKGDGTKKETKKKASKSLKEKRAEKKAKKQTKDS
jgi:hypothetical protein